MNLILFYILHAALLYVPIKESIHMLQQNRYQRERYHAWLKACVHNDHKAFYKRLLSLLPLWTMCFVSHPLYLYLWYLCIGVYAYLYFKADQKKAYIKKLVFTHRAKRLFFVHTLCCISLLYLIYLFVNDSVFILAMPFYYFMPWMILSASALICEPLEQSIKNSYVKDAKHILAQRDDLIKIGITGSYGKTSVKHILHTLLSEEYYTYMTPHSYNNLMGLTISIRTQLNSLHQVMIAEMGADHVGEIDDLACFIKPSIAIITAVGPQHLSTFHTQENILNEKMRLIERLPFHGTAVLNYDNAYIRSYPISHFVKRITYGIHYEDADVRAAHIKYSPKGTSFTLLYPGGEIGLETVLLGEHNVLNILAAVSVALSMKIKPEQIKAAVKRLRYVEHRLQVRNMGSYTLLDDAYNSNPQGACYALDVLASMPNKRFLLTPGFLDLGEKTKEAHIAYAKKMLRCADVILLIGKKQTSDIYDTLCNENYPLNQIHICDTTKEALTLLQQMVSEGDCALIENDLPDAFNH